MGIVDILPEGLVNPILGFVESIPSARRFLSQLIINRYASAAAPRPRPYSLAVDGYTSWVTLTDPTYTGRHLPASSDEDQGSLPDERRVVDLMMRKQGKETLARDTSLLFPFFAQWFTDSFLRTDPTDFRKNQSNHQIDLCQIYGVKAATTQLLRAKLGGRLKSQTIDGDEYGVYMFEEAPDGSVRLKNEFQDLYDEVNFKRVFGKLSDPQLLKCFAVGLEHGNSTLGNVLMNTLFLREHNRLASVLEESHPTWDDDRLFETARNINIVLILKIVIEDYIRHISGFDVPFEAVPGMVEDKDWYRTNWISVEFNLLYRWHGLIPNQFRLGSETYDSSRLVNANDLFLQSGVDQLLRDATTQRAGRIGLGHTPEFLRHVKERTVALARRSNLMSYNAYRAHFGLTPFWSFEQLTRDHEVIDQLKELYGTIDRVEYLVGLLAEDYAERDMMGELQMTMVAHDAFTHALTNPLLAKRIFNDETFAPEGMSEIASTSTLVDVILRNTNINDRKSVSFKYMG